MKETTRTALQALIAVDETIPKKLGLKALAILGGTDTGEELDRPISYREAAEMLNCPTRTLRDWVRRGVIRTIGKGLGSMTKISKKSVLAYLAGDQSTTAA